MLKYIRPAKAATFSTVPTPTPPPLEAFELPVAAGAAGPPTA
jgi:hypothetical protein